LLTFLVTGAADDSGFAMGTPLLSKSYLFARFTKLSFLGVVMSGSFSIYSGGRLLFLLITFPYYGFGKRSVICPRSLGTLIVFRSDIS
jgi:hypothetical protein